MATLNARISANAIGRAKSGNTTLALIGECLDHYSASGDWTPLARMATVYQNGENGRNKRIMSALGIVFSKDDKQPTGLRLNKKKTTEAMGAAGNGDMIWCLAQHVAAGNGIWSKALSEPLEGVTLIAKNETAFDLAKAAKAYVAKAREEGVEFAAIQDAVMAAIEAAVLAEEEA